jgi:hypothetical protein
MTAEQKRPWRDLAHAAWHLLDDHAEEVGPGDYQISDLPGDVWTPKIGRALDALGMFEHDDIDRVADRVEACIDACADMRDPAAKIAEFRETINADGVQLKALLRLRDRLLADIRYAVQFFEHARSVEELAVIRKRLLAGIEACEPCRHSTMPLRNGGGKCMSCGDIIEDQP